MVFSVIVIDGAIEIYDLFSAICWDSIGRIPNKHPVMFGNLLSHFLNISTCIKGLKSRSTSIFLIFFANQKSKNSLIPMIYEHCE